MSIKGNAQYVVTHLLTHNILGKVFSRRHTALFSYFSKKTGFDSSCKLSPMETICMKCQILLSWKNKSNIINLWSAELSTREVKVTRSARNCDKFSQVIYSRTTRSRCGMRIIQGARYICTGCIPQFFLPFLLVHGCHTKEMQANKI